MPSRCSHSAEESKDRLVVVGLYDPRQSIKLVRTLEIHQFRKRHQCTGKIIRSHFIAFRSGLPTRSTGKHFSMHTAARPLGSNHIWRSSAKQLKHLQSKVGQFACSASSFRKDRKSVV